MLSLSFIGSVILGSFNGAFQPYIYIYICECECECVCVCVCASSNSAKAVDYKVGLYGKKIW
jgi:hypothetical protein